MRAKKSYGQHFLNSEKIAARIAESLTLAGQSYEKVLEVGPGRGMLTQFLLRQQYKLIAVEADQDMVAFLYKHFPELKGQVVVANFLKTPLPELMQEKPFGLIGNFPYNISSQIVFKMLDNRAHIPEMVGMFQKEVAERITAGPGSKAYGVISVLVQAHYQGEYLFSVGKGQFTPPPKVKSGVIRLLRKEKYELACDHRLFRQVVKQAFSQRRKMLRNTMKTFIKGDPLLSDSFFDQRPERLSHEDFIQLTQWIAERTKEE